MALKNNKTLAAQAFDAQAESYDASEDASVSKYPKECYPHILSLIQSRNDQVLLDLGCGTGAVLEQIECVLPGKELHGLDLSPKMIAQAQRKTFGNATFVVGDAENLPFESGMFDSVICCCSLHHYPDAPRALAEMHRVLRVGGMLILCDIYYGAVSRTIMNCVVRGRRDRGDVHFFSQKELHLLLRQAGLHRPTFQRNGKRTFVATVIK